MVASKDLRIPVRIDLTMTTTVGGTHRSIVCACGQSVSGRCDIVDEAHRQHVQNHGIGRMVEAVPQRGL